MAAGVYFCRLESDHGGQKIDQTIKMVVLP